MNILSRVRICFGGGRERRARALPDGFNDVVDLYDRGLVYAKGNGQSITEISAEVISRVTTKLKVTIGHGTYFVSRGNHQNMVTRRECRFELGPFATERIHLPASCINASLPIPRNRDRFRGVARVPTDVRSFLRAAEQEDAMVIQAGIWAITDGFSRQQVQATLRTRNISSPGRGPLSDVSGSDQGPAISTLQIGRAKAILGRLGIANHL